jgi:hypothetical protein
MGEEMQGVVRNPSTTTYTLHFRCIAPAIVRSTVSTNTASVVCPTSLVLIVSVVDIPFGNRLGNRKADTIFRYTTSILVGKSLSEAWNA